MQAYFKYVNEEKGGVCSRKIDCKAEDDQYDPAKAVEVIRRLVEQDHIFAMVRGLGTAAHSAVWDYLNEKGIPDLWVMSRRPQVGSDPKGTPGRWLPARLLGRGHHHGQVDLPEHARREGGHPLPER